MCFERGLPENRGFRKASLVTSEERQRRKCIIWGESVPHGKKVKCNSIKAEMCLDCSMNSKCLQWSALAGTGLDNNSERTRKDEDALCPCG